MWNQTTSSPVTVQILKHFVKWQPISSSLDIAAISVSDVNKLSPRVHCIAKSLIFERVITHHLWRWWALSKSLSYYQNMHRGVISEGSNVYKGSNQDLSTPARHLCPRKLFFRLCLTYAISLTNITELMFVNVNKLTFVFITTRTLTYKILPRACIPWSMSSLAIR